MELGRLTPVAAREVWAHEALDFTPWLLANVDVLSDLLDMDLVLERAEHPVGSFSLDLVGRDMSTDRVVIVENQLELSDHGHLGQLLTYAAGTDPATIVWITTGFRPEHRAAIDWLNEHTDEQIGFFGVEIHVVRIGESSAAPAFQLVAQPNGWGKRVKLATSAASSALTERERLYWDFWEQFRTKIQTEHPGWSRARTSTRSSWFNMSIGRTGTVMSLTFAREGLGAYLYFELSDAEVNLARFRFLQERQHDFESALGGPAIWDEMEGKKGAKIGLLSPFTTVTDIERWPEITAWLIDAQLGLRRAFDAVGGPAAL